MQRHLLKIVVGTMFLAVGIVGCKDDSYDLRKEIDTNINVGGDNLTLPIGSLESLTLGRFIEPNDVLLVENGRYVISKKDFVNVVVPRMNAVVIGSKAPVLPPVKINFNKLVGRAFFDVLVADAPVEIREMDVNQSINEQVVSLEQAFFSDECYIDLQFKVAGLPAGITKMWFDNYVIAFPKYIVFKPGEVNANNELVLNGEFDPNLFSKRLILDHVAFGAGAVSAGVIFEQGEVSLGGGLMLKDVNLELSELDNVYLKPAVKMSPLPLGVAVGIFNPEIDAQNVTFGMDDLPEFLQGDDVVLDLYTTALNINFSNAIGIGMNMDFNLIPRDNQGQEIQAGVVQQKVFMNPAQVLGAPTVSNAWVSNIDANMPVGYTYYQNSTITKLIRKMPQSIYVNVNALADQTKAGSIDINANYNMKINFEMVAPLELGQELSINYSESMSDIHQTLEDFVDYITELDLIVTSVNEIPLDLILSAEAYDQQNRPIGVSVQVQGTVLSGQKDGTATTSTITIKMKEEKAGELQKLDIISLNFKGKANASVVGASLQAQQKLNISLKASVPGGLNIKL